MASRAQPAGMQTRRRKRIQPPVYGGIAGSYSDRDSDFICPVCFNIIDEAYMTKCGHTFCFSCIKQSLSQNHHCPKCNYVLTTDDIYPNFLLNELILKHKTKGDKRFKFSDQNGILSPIYEEMFRDDDIDLCCVNNLLDYLNTKKSQLVNDAHSVQYKILCEFLQDIRRHKQQQLEEIESDMKIIDHDLAKCEEWHRELGAAHSSQSSADGFSILNCMDSSSVMQKAPILSASVTNHSQSSSFTPTDPTHLPPTTYHSSYPQSFNGSSLNGTPWLQTTMASRRKRVTEHFDDLQDYYLTRRRTQSSNEGCSDAGLSEFIDCLSKFTRFTSFRPLATLSYASDIYNGSSIVSSIEFDRDCDYFAIAGVTKKIKVFEYETIVRDAVDMHYPVNEMICNSKISSLSWSTYHKGLMASSDYEGTVTLWDAFTGVKSKIFQEHEKRCWSVDFNRMDPKLLASGSDDAKVKVWSTNSDHSLSSLEAKANVCCVKFSPTSCFHLAFGSADHCVHYYDLRHTKQPVVVFRGHKKAVSYVKFLNSHELVSASTDSQLKSWNLNEASAIRTFTGHINDKNFVGLASDGDYISCGSENNSLYIYYKGLSKHLLYHKFDTVRSVLEKDKKEEDTNEFVSAVSWRPGSNVLVAANSQGTVKLLELV